MKHIFIWIELLIKLIIELYLENHLLFKTWGKINTLSCLKGKNNSFLKRDKCLMVSFTKMQMPKCIR